jgi:branched-chain amino acid aminotransferase
MKEKGGEFVWFDGKLVKWEDAKVPIYTHALHYGTAVFEGIRAYAAKDSVYIFRFTQFRSNILPGNLQMLQSSCYKRTRLKSRAISAH